MVDPNNSVLRINVSGQSFIVYRNDVIQRAPYSRLGKLLAQEGDNSNNELYDAWLSETSEYYFERSPAIFKEIAHYYKSGMLHVPPCSAICLVEFLQEIQYWRIILNEHNLQSCCSSQIPRSFLQPVPPDEFEGQVCSDARRKVHHILMRPKKTLIGKIYAALTVAFVLMSISMIIILSMDCCRAPHNVIPLVNRTNGSLFATAKENSQFENANICRNVGAICTVWFTLELIVGIWAAPKRCAFLLNPLNIINFLAVAPFYLSLGLHLQMHDSKEKMVALDVIHAFGVIRILLVLKFTRLNSGFQLVIQTLRNSWRELLFMISIVMMLNLTVCITVFYIERQSPTNPFDTALTALYWSVISTMTVGYGDYYPTTTGGKIVACLGIMVGITIMAFPVATISQKFTEIYEEEKRRKMLKNSLGVERITLTEAELSLN